MALNYYQILGVLPNASQSEIKQAYLTKILDVSINISETIEAIRVLSNEVRRKLYDENLKKGSHEEAVKALEVQLPQSTKGLSWFSAAAAEGHAQPAAAPPAAAAAAAPPAQAPIASTTALQAKQSSGSWFVNIWLNILKGGFQLDREDLFKGMVDTMLIDLKQKLDVDDVVLLHALVHFEKWIKINSDSKAKPLLSAQQAYKNLIIGIWLAHKFTDDAPFTIDRWARQTSYSKKELSDGERKYLGELGYKLQVKDKDVINMLVRFSADDHLRECAKESSYVKDLLPGIEKIKQQRDKDFTGAATAAALYPLLPSELGDYIGRMFLTKKEGKNLAQTRKAAAVAAREAKEAAESLTKKSKPRK